MENNNCVVLTEELMNFFRAQHNEESVVPDFTTNCSLGKTLKGHLLFLDGERRDVGMREWNEMFNFNLKRGSEILLNSKALHGFMSVLGTDNDGNKLVDDFVEEVKVLFYENYRTAPFYAKIYITPVIFNVSLEIFHPGYNQFFKIDNIYDCGLIPETVVDALNGVFEILVKKYYHPAISKNVNSGKDFQTILREHLTPEDIWVFENPPMKLKMLKDSVTEFNRLESPLRLIKIEATGIDNSQRFLFSWDVEDLFYVAFVRRNVRWIKYRSIEIAFNSGTVYCSADLPLNFQHTILCFIDKLLSFFEFRNTVSNPEFMLSA